MVKLAEQILEMLIITSNWKTLKIAKRKTVILRCVLCGRTSNYVIKS